MQPAFSATSPEPDRGRSPDQQIAGLRLGQGNVDGRLGELLRGRARQVSSRPRRKRSEPGPSSQSRRRRCRRIGRSRGRPPCPGPPKWRSGWSRRVTGQATVPELERAPLGAGAGGRCAVRALPEPALPVRRCRDGPARAPPALRGGPGGRGQCAGRRGAGAAGAAAGGPAPAGFRFRPGGCRMRLADADGCRRLSAAARWAAAVIAARRACWRWRSRASTRADSSAAVVFLSECQLAHQDCPLRRGIGHCLQLGCVGLFGLGLERLLRFSRRRLPRGRRPRRPR